jgi:predicted XRE-type DNA-binding protein
LASRINDLIEEKNYNQKQAGEILGINQPKISALLNGRLEGFSMERLIHFLNCLDQDVKILITEKPKRRKNHGKLQVAFA